MSETTDTKATAILLGIELALTLMEKLLPDLIAGVKTGTISTDQQKSVMSRVAALRAPAAFDGPEWVPSTDTKPAV